MFKKIITSFGSKSILENIKKKYSDRKMLILSNSAEDAAFQLIDFSDKENIFQSPNRYQVLFESGPSVAGDIFIFDFFELSDDSIKSFDQRIREWANQNANSYTLQNSFILNPLDGKPNNRVVLSIWNSEANGSTFEMRDLKKITSPYLNQNAFQTTYHVID